MTVPISIICLDFETCVAQKAPCLRAAASCALYLPGMEMFAKIKAGNVTQ